MGNQTSSGAPSSPLHLLAKRINKKKKAPFYPVPPNAERPSAPSCPEVFQDQDQYFILRWDPPVIDGGCPIIGYVIQHLELGLPQLESQQECDDNEAWYSSDPGQISQTECILNNLVPGTTYQFRVMAENLLGYSPPSDVSEPIVFNPHGELDDWFFAPSFSVKLEETYTAMEHEMLTVGVELKGQPYPLVRWYDKNEVDVCRANSAKFRGKSSGPNRTLTIANLQLADAGTYRCVGENKQGSVDCSTYITVEAPPRIQRLHSEFAQSEEDVKDGLVEDEYEDLIFQAGELVRLKFLYSGWPRPDLQLFHNGEAVVDPRVITEFTEKVVTVKVGNILREDRGEWLVRLENVLGEDCTSVLITITDRPSAAGKPEILQLSDNTCILCWTEPNDDGGCPVHNYIVEYFRSEWGVWLKALTSKTLNAKIKDLIPGSKYTFRVKAENLYGVSEASEESVEILITDSRVTSGDNGGLMRTVEESVEEDEDPFTAEEATSTFSQPQKVEKREEESRRENSRREEDLKREELRREELKREELRREELKREESKREELRREELKMEESKREEESSVDSSVKKLYTRSDLIRSCAERSEDYMRRFLEETMKVEEEVDRKLKSPSFDEDEDFEYDFDKLQKEYEDEMRLLNPDLSDEESEEEESDKEEEGHSEKEESSEEGEEHDEEEESKNEVEEEPPVVKDLEEWDYEESVALRIAKEREEARRAREEKAEAQKLAVEAIKAVAARMKEEVRAEKVVAVDDNRTESREDALRLAAEEKEAEEEWERLEERRRKESRVRVVRSEEKTMKLGDRFTDYLTMKVSSRNKKIGSSLRSLNSLHSNGSTRSRDTSTDNLRRMLDFDDDDEEDPRFPPSSPPPPSFSPPLLPSNDDSCYVRHAPAPSPPPAPPQPERVSPPKEACPPAEEPVPSEVALVPRHRWRKRGLYLLLLPLLYVSPVLMMVVVMLILLWNKCR